MVKITGIILILVSSAAYGFNMSKDLKTHLNELMEIKKIMFLLRGEIEYGMCPVKEALKNIAARCSSVFSNVLAGLAEKDDCTDFRKHWEEEWTKGFENMLLTPDEQTDLINFKDVISLNDKEAEVMQIDLYLSKLESAICQLRETIPKKSRIYKCLSLGTGIFLSIIFM